MVKILIDLSKLKNLNCGLGQVALNLGKYLSVLPNSKNFIFLVPKEFIGYFGDDVQYQTANIINKFIPVFYPQVSIWHLTHQMSSFKPVYNSKIILTIHDLNFIFEKKSKQKRDKEIKKLQAKVDRASILVFISKFVQNMANGYLNISPNKVQTVIYNGVDIDIDRKVSRPDFLPEGEFFFTISEIREKKNFSILIDFIERMPPDVKAVIAGNNNTAYAREMRGKIAQKGLNKRVLMPGIISEDDKIYLYRHCKAFLFPSLYEGFGLPTIEAMRFGKPVFTSTSTSLPEIAGELAFYWEHFDVDYMIDVYNEKMRLFDNDANYATKLKQYSQKYSWKENASKYNDLYNTL